VEGDALELLRVLGERVLRSWSQKKRASLKARGEDLAVAVDDRGRVRGFDVGGADEGVGELAAAARRRSISGLCGRLAG
jgi:hypothetical protein